MKNNISPNRLLGQNWLVNVRRQREIVKAGAIEKSDTVLEIGAGTGLMTEILADCGAVVLAVEKDRRLTVFLEKRFAGQKNVKIIEGDILKIDPADLGLKRSGYKVVGNIPYYLTSRLLRLMLENWPAPRVIILTVQDEVAKRMTARPPKMNLLALAVQFYAQAEIVQHISRRNFRPVPRVDSAIVKVIPGLPFLKNRAGQKAFFMVAKAGFGGKRKQLINSISTNLGKPKNTLNTILAEAGIDPTRRPESLKVEEWAKLSSLLFPLF